MDDFTDHLYKALTLLPAIFMVLSIHEYGHYIIARVFGVHADEYAIGYGKTLFKRRVLGRTDIIFKALPLGAHVQLNDAEFNALGYWKKMSVIAAGPFMNALIVLPLFLIFFTIVGQPSTPPVLAAVEIGSVAEKAGLHNGDKITTANGIEIKRYEQIFDLTRAVPIKPVQLEIERLSQKQSVTITPEEISYIDIDGLKQTHGRLGVIVRHAPFDLEAIASLNDIPIKHKDDKAARAALIEYLGQNVIIGFKSNDGTIRHYKTWLDEDLNKDLKDKNAKHFDAFFIGTLGSHFYLKLPLAEAIPAALRQTKDIFGAVLKIPFQVFPIDKEKLTPSETAENKPITNWFYNFIFLSAALSVVVGFINLFPLPHFDGGQMILMTAEKINGGSLTPKKRALIITISIFLIYAIIAGSNFVNFKTYTNHKICGETEWKENTRCKK